jgi:hypothetical protein
MIEWMPVNPCDCEDPKRDIEQCDEYCLEQRNGYGYAKAAQLKLLEYLLSKNAIGLIMYKEMVKQLEEK